MRDDQIYRFRNESNKNLSMFYRQLVFVQTRLDAYEAILSEMRFWDILKSIFNRQYFMDRLNSFHLDLMNKHDKEVKEIMEKEEMERKKTKIQIVGANGFSKLSVFFVAALFASGCVSLKKYNKLKNEMLNDKAQSDRVLDRCKQIVKGQENEIKAKTARLKRFNQVDDKGNLIKPNYFKGDIDPDGWDSPDGSEPWLK